MNGHPYLRAYMAGIALPTAFLLVALSVFCVWRFLLHIPVPIERMIVFPMALVPNLWGAWNMLYLALRTRYRWEVGLHGAILPAILAPMGYGAATVLGFLKTTAHGFAYFDVVHVPFALAGTIFSVAIAIYYLAWKYVVSFLNRVVETGE